MEKFAPKLLFIFVITIFLDVVSPKSHPFETMASQPYCEAPPYQKNSETDACSLVLEFHAAYQKFEDMRKISDLVQQRKSLAKQLDAIMKKVETRTRSLSDRCLNFAPPPLPPPPPPQHHVPPPPPPRSEHFRHNNPPHPPPQLPPKGMTSRMKWKYS